MRRKLRRCGGNCGFTLIELVISIVVVVVVLAVMIICGILIYNCGAGHDCADHNHTSSGEVAR